MAITLASSIFAKIIRNNRLNLKFKRQIFGNYISASIKFGT